MLEEKRDAWRRVPAGTALHRVPVRSLSVRKTRAEHYQQLSKDLQWMIDNVPEGPERDQQIAYAEEVWQREAEAERARKWWLLENLWVLGVWVIFVALVVRVFYWLWDVIVGF